MTTGWNTVNLTVHTWRSVWRPVVAPCLPTGRHTDRHVWTRFYRTELFYYPPVVTTNMHNRTRNCIYAKYHLDTNKYNFNNTKCSWCYYYLQFRLHFPSNIHIEIVWQYARMASSKSSSQLTAGMASLIAASKKTTLRSLRRSKCPKLASNKCTSWL